MHNNKISSQAEKKDNLYLTGKGPKPFAFNKEVTQVFADMIRRSVPSYEKIINTQCQLAQKYVQKQTLCYDLGCSLGETSIKFSQKALPFKKIIAIDDSQSMIEQAQYLAQKADLKTPLMFIQDDINNLSLEPSSVILLNYTLQFIPKKLRPNILRHIVENLNPNGILLICEKVSTGNPNTQDVIDELYKNHKKNNGYHELEISEKRDALEEVLISDTIKQHHKRFKEAGFSNWQIWHQEYSFVSWIVWR